MSQSFFHKWGLRFACFLLLIWSLGPLYWTLSTSLMYPKDIASSPIHFLPPEISFENYRKLLGGLFSLEGEGDVWRNFSNSLINSLVLAFGATIATTFIAALSAYACVRMKFPGRNIIFYLIIATLAVPGYTVLIPLYRLMVALQLIDSYSGIILIYISAFLPLAMWLMRAIYEALPLSIEEAAYLDGAGRLYTMFRIVMPLAAPGLIAASILTFLGSWGQFSIPLVFAPTSATKPLTVFITEFSTRNYIDYGLISAAGIVAIIPPAIVVIFLNRYLLNGLMAGAGK